MKLGGIIYHHRYLRVCACVCRSVSVLRLFKLNVHKSFEGKIEYFWNEMFCSSPFVFFMRRDAAATITVAFSASCFTEMFRYRT